MSELDDAVTALRRAFFDGAEFVDPFNAVIEAGDAAPVAAKNAAIRALLDGLTGAEPEHVGYLAVASGALVEQGGSSLESLDVLLDQIAEGGAALVAAGPAVAEADLDRGVVPAGIAPREQGWILGFKRLVVGTMARLARNVEARQRARAHPRFERAVRGLADFVGGWHVQYLVEVLDMLDDAPLLLIDTGANTVTRMRVYGVRGCFHLLTLLEGQDPFELEQRGVASVSIERGYYTWRYLGVTSGLAREVVQTMIPGDMRAVDLPQFEGARVVVRTPTGVHRSWDFSFVAPFHDALLTSLIVEAELTGADAQALRDRMAAG